MRTFHITVAYLLVWLIASSFVPPKKNYYSIDDGQSSAFQSWSTSSHDGAHCNCSPGCEVDAATNIFIQHDLTFHCTAFHLRSGSSMIIRNEGSLNVNGGLHLDNGTVHVLPGSSLTVKGDLTVRDNGSLKVDGKLMVTGSVTIANGTVCGTGTADVLGAIAGDGWCKELQVLHLGLKSFSADPAEDGTVSLRLETTTRLHNDQFMVERSVNGLTFHEVTSIRSSGKEGTALVYEATDPDPVEGVAYYRLRQTNFNGQHLYFPMIALSYFGKSDQPACILEMSPGTCLPNCIAHLNGCKAGESRTLRADIHDIRGNAITNETKFTPVGSNFSFHLNTGNNLSPGLYLIPSSRIEQLKAAKAATP
ncbi:MAG: hypothetical protein AAGB22_01005 [Bacteroidota bacterium]